MPIWKGRPVMAYTLGQLYRLMLSNRSTIDSIEQIDDRIIIRGEYIREEDIFDDSWIDYSEGAHVFTISPGGLYYYWRRET